MALRPQGGSRFLYEPFDVASARVDALERVTDERWAGLERRLMGLETMIDRLERRMWMAVCGTITVLISEFAFYAMTRVVP
ncbi:MAG: hypothetical protein AAFQ51_06150 [Pseudomonadota bacterium]